MAHDYYNTQDYYQVMAPEDPATQDVYSYEQYPTQRSKTPLSLLNHTGRSLGSLSPGGPLSTPPMSRDASRGSEPLPPQYPDQMMYDWSASSSPNSVRTPDNESSEESRLDSPTRPLFTGSAGMFLTAQGTISEQAMYGALRATMLDQHFHSQQLIVPTRPLQTSFSLGEYNPYDDQIFANQAPWTSEQPLRNPNIPHSGILLFDPATDPVDYSAFVSTDSWREHNTDPNYLISHNEPGVPPQELSPIATQTTLEQQQACRQWINQGDVYPHPHLSNASPIETVFQEASLPPDAYNHANYSTSALDRQNYRMVAHHQPPPIATSIETFPSNTFQSPDSTLASASSPGGSEGMFSSYQQSDPGTEHLDSERHQPFQLVLPSRSSLDAFSPTRKSLEAVMDVSPKSKGKPAGRQVGPIRTAGRPGGRALGTHLDKKVARAAQDMRKTVACWHCVLQRDRCGPGKICDRCLKRAQRPNADCGLGCSRSKLIDLSEYFLPSIVMQIHEERQLTYFVSQFIHQWCRKEITVYMTCSSRKMPRIPIKVYEFQPRGEELLVQIQYRTDVATQKRYTVQKRSPPLGMMQINYNDEKKYNKYLDDIVDNHLDAFGEICWAEDDNDFTPRLFKLMTRVNPQSEDEAKLFRDIFRLIVCTYIMSHTPTIAEDTKGYTLPQMHSYTDPSVYTQSHTSPRLTARQMKFFFARLQREILGLVLNKLQQIFKSSKGCEQWLAAFVGVVGIAMALEDMQKTAHQVMATRAATEHLDPREEQARAEAANREGDARMHFVMQIFRYKYHRKCNPLQDHKKAWEKEVGFEDEESVRFVRSVAQLVTENMDYLQQRQSISIAEQNQADYTARLTARFLLSFWLP